MYFQKLLPLVLGCLFLASTVKAGTGDADNASSEIARTHAASFLENKGQITDETGRSRTDIDYCLKATKGLNIYIGAGILQYQFFGKAGNKAFGPQPANTSISTYRMEVALIGANPNAAIVTEGKKAWFEKHFTPATGPDGVTAYAYDRIIYKNIYPKIDWVLYTDANVGNGGLKHEFIVHPGGNPRDIKLQYGGASTLEMNAEGALVATTPQGKITEQAPYVYQKHDGKKVPAKFSLADKYVTYNIGNYAGELVIDPLLSWATYFGGEGDENSATVGASRYVATDAAGNVYLTGVTPSLTGIATSGAFQTVFAGGLGDIYLAKFSNSGTLLWATYFGGPGVDQVSAIAVDPSGNIFMSGVTTSASGISTPGTHRSTHGSSYCGGCGTYNDAFIAKFSSSGARTWATYYESDIEDIATDASGNLFITGKYTGALTGVPSETTTGAHQTTTGGGNDAILAKFSSTGVRQWATLYGGSRHEEGRSIAIDPSGNVIIGGLHQSSAFADGSGIATAGAHQTTPNGSYGVFVSKFTTSGALLWGTFYGGETSFAANQISVATNASGDVYFAGLTTLTSGIATTGVYQTAFGGFMDGYLVKLNGSGIRQWGTYYGTDGFDVPRGLGTDASGDITMCGISNSSFVSLATACSHEPTHTSLDDEAFVARFSPAGALNCATYFGGINAEGRTSIAVTPSGEMFLAGHTQSTTSIATSGAFKTSISGGHDDFLAKFTGCLAVPVLSGPGFVCMGSVVHLSASIPGGTWSVDPSFTSLASVNATTGLVTLGSTMGNPVISYTLPTGCSRTWTLNIVAASGSAPITGTQAVCMGGTTSLSATLSGGTWQSSAPAVASIASTSGLVTANTVGTSVVSYTAPNGCYTAAIITVNLVPTSYSVTGGGTYCPGSACPTISLSNSQTGVNYSLYNGASFVSSVAGTGSALSLGAQCSAGTYTVAAIAAIGGCSAAFTGAPQVVVLPAPPAQAVAGGGNYCLGDACPHITLAGSASGNNYQLYNDGSPVGTPVAGTGSALDFGAQCTMGTYTVLGTNTTSGCTTAMSSSASVAAFPLPGAGFSINNPSQPLSTNNFVFTVSSAPSNYAFSWDFGDGSPLSTLTSPSHSYTAAGPYNVVQQVTNTTTGCINSSNITVNVFSDSVTGGGGGGLESESLGGIVSKLDFYNIKNSVDRRVNYATKPVYMHASANVAAKGTATSSPLNRFIPQSLDAATTGYVNSPSRIITITKAVDVLAVDYVKDNRAKAVSLGIVTLGSHYAHTKSVCDRFREATLLGTEKVAINGFNLIRYAMKQANGTVEYCIAFDAGKSASRATFALQTNWLINQYKGDDSMFNFQVWAAQPEHAVKLATDILNNLAAIMPVEQVDTAFALPTAYVAAGQRSKGSLEITLTSEIDVQNAELRFEERANEFSGIYVIAVPFTLTKGKANKVSIPIKDGYEYPGYLYVNGKIVDLVYMADGNWSLDYDATYTHISKYNVENNPTRIYADDEYPVYRGVSIKAESPDYISAYKFISSGNVPVDLTGYRSFKFTAKANGPVSVMLVKNSITYWKQQYTTDITLDSNISNYAISFDDFTSTRSGQPFLPNDVTAVVFTWGFSGKQTTFSFKGGDISFSKDAVTSVKALQSKAVNVSPNPSNGAFTVNFVSDRDQQLDITISDISGKKVLSQTVSAKTGKNTVNVTLPQTGAGASVLILTLGNKSVKYEQVKLSLFE